MASERHALLSQHSHSWVHMHVGALLAASNAVLALVRLGNS